MVWCSGAEVFVVWCSTKEHHCTRLLFQDVTEIFCTHYCMWHSQRRIATHDCFGNVECEICRWPVVHCYGITKFNFNRCFHVVCRSNTFCNTLNSIVHFLACCCAHCANRSFNAGNFRNYVCCSSCNQLGDRDNCWVPNFNSSSNKCLQCGHNFAGNRNRVKCAERF